MSKILVQLAGGAAGKSSVWKNFKVEEAVNAATALYGPQAATAACYCALDAWVEARRDDYAFWFEVFSSLKGREPAEM